MKHNIKNPLIVSVTEAMIFKRILALAAIGYGIGNMMSNLGNLTPVALVGHF